MVKVWVIFSVTAVKGFSVSSAQASYGRRWTAAQLFKRRQGGHSQAAIKSWVSRKLFGLFLTLKSFSLFTKTELVFICCRFVVQSMFLSFLSPFFFSSYAWRENNRFNKWNRRKHKLGWNMFISKLGPKQRGRGFAGWGGASLIRSSVKPRLPRTVGREERQGEKPGKGPSHFVLLFGNELWLNPGRRQTVYKEPGITLSLFTFQGLQFRSRAPYLL